METERLIEEVRKRPLLYDNTLSGNNKELKPQLWLEVARQVLPEWESLSASQQQTRVIEIQRRWRTLRDNFKRELKYQKSVEYGAAATKRKKYKHFDTLSFLEPTLDRKSMYYGEGMMQYGTEMLIGNEIMTMDDSYNSFDDKSRVKMLDDFHTAHRLEADADHYTPQNDPDEMFFLSLIPAFKRLSEEQKSLAKIKLTQLMHDLVYTSNDGATSTTTSN